MGASRRVNGCTGPLNFMKEQLATLEMTDLDFAFGKIRCGQNE